LPRKQPSSHVYELAKRGAQARLEELVNEIRLLTNLFPDLHKSIDNDELPIAFLLKRGAERSTPVSGRRGWTPAQRKEAAARMKAYWAKRKAPAKKS